jgi:SNF2 family DNA or RNA helicase
MTSSAKYAPRNYQRMGTRFLLDHPRCMLVADPGLGKTGMTLSALELLKLGGSNFFPALVLAPKRVADVVWTGERDKWSTFHGLSMIKITGNEAQRLEALRRPMADVYVLNYELAPWILTKFPAEKWPFKIVVADESSKLKGFRLNQGGVRAAALSKIARFTGRWWCLTGTPAPNGLQDLWGQFWYVDFGERLKRSFTAFKEAYFIENPYTRKISLQNGSQTAIHAALSDRLLAFRAEDWLDIQKPQEIPVEVNLPPTALAQYREMEKDFFLRLTDAEIEAGTAAARSTKLLQIASGSIYDENTAPHPIHDAKLEALTDILDQIAPKPLLVTYWWKFDVPRILKAMASARIAARVYSGQRDEDDWNAGKIRVLLLQEQSAHGLNLHAPCHDVCFYSYTWNAEYWQQMIERVGPARQAQLGLKRVVRVWSIRAKGTIEADVVESNERKISVEQALKRARARRLAE